MGIFLSTVLVLFVVSAAFRKGCLLMILIPIILGFGYYAYRDQARRHDTPSVSTSHTTPAARNKAPRKTISPPAEATTHSDAGRAPGDGPATTPGDDLRDNP
jgi:hypothetical protein